MDSPCFNCPNRKVEKGYNCHSHCELYLVYHDERIKVLEEKQKEFRKCYSNSRKGQGN